MPKAQKIRHQIIGTPLILFYGMIHHTRIGISIPTEMFADIESIRKTSNRSKFISELIRKALRELKGGTSQ